MGDMDVPCLVFSAFSYFFSVGNVELKSLHQLPSQMK
jgi:hypothetical protein